MKIRMLAALIAAGALAGTATAQAFGGGGGNEKLSVGSPAPKLAISEWVKGQEVKEFVEDHMYVIEFWATW